MHDGRSCTRESLLGRLVADDVGIAVLFQPTECLIRVPFQVLNQVLDVVIDSPGASVAAN